MKKIALLTFLLLTGFGLFAQVPIVHYTFNGTLADSMGNGPTGIASGTITQVPNRFGISNGAYMFSNSSADMGSSTIWNFATMSQHTIATWVKVNTQGSTDGRIFCLDDDINKKAYEIIYNRTTSQFYYSNFNNGVNYDTYSPSTISLGKWYHLAVTMNSSTSSTKFYVDGALAGSSSLPIYRPVNPTLDIATNYLYPWYFLGDIDQFSIYNQELTAQQIQTLANDRALNVSSNPLTMQDIEVNPYPNPVTEGFFEIELKGMNGAINYSVSDISGRLLISEVIISDGSLKKTIDVSSLKPGAYFLNMHTENGTIQKKLLIF